MIHVKDLLEKLKKFPDNYEVELYSDENTDGIAISNPSGIITTIETVIEI
jgi:hypothetical protein